MGRSINQQRKISDDRVRKPRKTKKTIIIAAEGKNKTESIYFNNFDDGKKNYSIIMANGNATDPVNLVKMLSTEIIKRGLDMNEGDLAFCVFDTDIDSIKNRAIKEAKKLADKNRIIIITSSPCFELWFLLHYKYTTAKLSNDEVITNLKKYLSNYEKNKNVFPIIKENISNAIQNAKKLEKYQQDNGRDINLVEANPHSEVYKIIEELERISSN